MIWSINPPHPPYNRVSDCDSAVFNTYYRDMPVDELLCRDNVSVNKKNKKALEKLELNAKVYFLLVKSVNEEIERVLKALKEAWHTDNTVIVFTSDHGEMMGSYGRMQK